METTEKIEKYLDGELSNEELKSFTNDLETDMKLASEVAFIRDVNESIVDDEVFFLRQKLSLLITSTSKRRALIKVVSGVAASLIVLVSIISITNHTSPEKAYNSYYSPYAADLSTRSEVVQLQGLEYGIKLYSQGEYETAFEIINKFSLENTNSVTAKYYAGLSALELNKFENAEKSFQAVIENGDYAYTLHSKWYLGMLYLKTEQTEKAVLLFEELANDENFYAAKARKILKKHI